MRFVIIPLIQLLADIPSAPMSVLCEASPANEQKARPVQQTQRFTPRTGGNTAMSMVHLLTTVSKTTAVSVWSIVAISKALNTQRVSWHCNYWESLRITSNRCGFTTQPQTHHNYSRLLCSAAPVLTWVYVWEFLHKINVQTNKNRRNQLTTCHCVASLAAFRARCGCCRNLIPGQSCYSSTINYRYT